MGFFDRIIKGVDYEKDDTPEMQPQQHSTVPPAYAGKKFSGYSSTEYYEAESRKATDCLVCAPASYDDVEIIIDHLKYGESVIINLKGIKSQTAQRILDFISGAIYSLDGSIQPIENGLFMLAPGGVSIMQKKNSR